MTTGPATTGVEPPAVKENLPLLLEWVRYEWFAASCRLTRALATGWPVVTSSTTPEIVDDGGGAGPFRVRLNPFDTGLLIAGDSTTETDDELKVAFPPGTTSLMVCAALRVNTRFAVASAGGGDVCAVKLQVAWPACD